MKLGVQCCKDRMHVLLSALHGSENMDLTAGVIGVNPGGLEGS